MKKSSSKQVLFPNLKLVIPTTKKNGEERKEKPVICSSVIQEDKQFGKSNSLNAHTLESNDFLAETRFLNITNLEKS